MLNQDENILFQSYFTFVLLVELKNNDFLHSQAFKDMPFGSPWIKESLMNDIGIDNQGFAVIALYVMLLIPKEGVLFKTYPREYEEIRQFVETHAQNVSTDYKNDNKRVDFLVHIRNAIAHARVSFVPNKAIVIRDESPNGWKFQCELGLNHLGELLSRLQSVHLKHIKTLQAAQQSSPLSRNP